MSRLIYYVESNLVWFVIIVAGLGLVLPEAGKYLQPLIGLLLAALMFIISLTFDAHAVRLVLRKTSRQFLALILVYGPMSLAGLLTGRFFFAGVRWLWVKLCLAPTDVSSPLLVLMARGNVALADVFNAVNTALSPFIVPLLFL